MFRWWTTINTDRNTNRRQIADAAERFERIHTCPSRGAVVEDKRVFPIHAVFNAKRERVGARVKIPQHRIVHQIDLVVVEHERRGTAHGLLLEFKLQIARHLNLEFDSVHLLTDIDGNGTHGTLIPRYNLHVARMIIHSMLQVLPSKEKNGCSAERRRLCPRA